MVDKDKALPKTIFPFIWHFLRQYKPVVIVYVTLALSAGFWGPFNSMLLAKVINLLPNVAGGDISVLILPASLIVVNFIVFDNFTWRGIAYIKYRYLPFILNKVDNVLLDYTLQHSYQFFGEHMAGSLSKQIFYLVDGTEKIISSSACNILRATSLLLMAFIFAYQVNIIFLGILVLWCICFLSISLFMSKKLICLSENQSTQESILGGQIIDSLTNAYSARLFARRGHEIARRSVTLFEYRVAYQKKEMYAFIMHSIQGGLIAIMMACSTFFLIYLYKKVWDAQVGGFLGDAALSVEMSFGGAS